MRSTALVDPLLYLVPVVLSAGSFVYARKLGIIGRPLPLMVVFVVAGLLQFASSMFSPAWAVGLVLQVGLAIYIQIQIKLAE